MIIKPTRREFIKSAALIGGGLLLPKLAIAGGAPSYGQTELIHTIRRCGLTSGLKLCLDAGDASSYSSGQSWLDTSGNGYDFFRGATGSAEGSDPTFNGTAGRRSSGEYWSFDGGDYFKYDTTNETWMNNLHKNNAKFTLMGWFYLTGSGPTTGFAGTNSASSLSNIGIDFSTDAGGTLLQASMLNGGGVSYGWGLSHSSNTLTAGAWNFCAWVMDEAVGANGAFFMLNGTQTLFTSTYTSPSASSASHTMEIGALGNGVAKLPNTSRLGMFAAWEGVALTKEQLNALYMRTRGRFGV